MFFVSLFSDSYFDIVAFFLFSRGRIFYASCPSSRRTKDFQNCVGDHEGVADVVSVLLVDDDPVQLRVNSKRLRTIIPDAVIDTAMDGLQGLERLSAHAYDCVVSDLHMPVMNGVTMLERADAEGVLPAVRCVSSAQGTEHVREMLVGTLELEEDEVFDKGDNKCALKTCAEKLPRLKQKRREMKAMHNDSDLSEVVVVDVDGAKKSSEKAV